MSRQKKERTKPAIPPSLEQRIAAALADDITSADLAALIEQVEAAANDAEKAAEEAQMRALDPTVADPAAAREVQREAEFTTKRLDAALPPLDARLAEVLKTEDLKRWHSDCDALEVQRDALAAELREVYSEFEAKIPNLFARIAANDKQLSNLHLARAAGVSRHLLGAELIARGLDHFSGNELAIAQALQLPAFEPGRPQAWPPRQVPLGVQVAQSMVLAPHPGANWARHAQERAAAVREEQQTVADYYEAQARQREERENAEAQERAEQARRVATR